MKTSDFDFLYLFNFSIKKKFLKKTASRRVKGSQNEILVIGPAHAVVDPRAVVVHSEDALLADPTVVAAVGLVPKE